MKTLESHYGVSVQDLSERVLFKNGIHHLTADYFTWATHQLTLGKFKTKRHKEIWRGHSEGQTPTEIAKTIGTTRSNIGKRIKLIRLYLKTQKQVKKS